tara:strand:- start:1226 stop:2674 length:1449 start_codon:yes stop_codon:yes gene_type:complete
MKKLSKNKKYLISAVFLFMIILTLLTQFEGTTDIKDYANVAKFFSGDLSSKIRTSHSYLFGFLHSPFIFLTKNFISLKLTSLIFLFLIVLSVYYISGKDKKALWLMLLSPIVWYMAPWISPIQLSSLLFLWAFYFIRKFDENEKISNLFYSGILIGLGWALWGSILFFGILLGISFLYNKKIYHSIYFLIFVFIGLLPRMILDQFLFGFPLYTIIRHIIAVISFSLLGGFYNQGSDFALVNIILMIIFIPVYSYILFTKKNFKKNIKTNIFIILSFLLIIANPQIRLTLIIIPILITSLTKYLDKKKFAFQIALFLIISLFVINPYLIQIKYETNATDFGSLIQNFPNIQINEFTNKIILQDLNEISTKYPNQTFVVGNTRDEYANLAFLYWGGKINEFVSIQDYQLYLNNEITLQEQSFCTNSKISNRRDFCFSALLRKSFNDKTNYSSIRYAISSEEILNLEGFEFIEKYQHLSLFKKLN